MLIKEKEQQKAFRQMDKPSKGDRTADEIRETLKEAGDAHSDMTRQKGAETREVIDSQNYNRRKAHKGLNSPQ